MKVGTDSWKLGGHGKGGPVLDDGSVEDEEIGGLVDCPTLGFTTTNPCFVSTTVIYRVCSPASSQLKAAALPLFVHF